MKKDIGFWDINGNYIEDIQEVNEVEMDKEIIIDGVNVAGCKDYDDGTCCNDDVLTLSCEKTNCMYKQLKRLGFELKVTKADYEASEQENAELKAENERLKEGITELEEKFLTLNGKSYSYYLTLQEIKSTMQGVIGWYQGDKEQINKILDLITKAEEE